MQNDLNQELLDRDNDPGRVVALECLVATRFLSPEWIFVRRKMPFWIQRLTKIMFVLL